MELECRTRVWEKQDCAMFRAIGFLITLWGISVFLSSAFSAFERAATATFDAVEAAAIKSQQKLEEL